MGGRGSRSPQTTALTARGGPCAAHGSRVGADGITLDRNGQQVFGTAATGDGAGVLVSAHTNVSVINGTVRAFDARRGYSANSVVRESHGQSWCPSRGGAQL